MSLLIGGLAVAAESASAPPPPGSAAETARWIETTARAFEGAQALDRTVLRLALNAAVCAREAGAVANERLLTVIDYSKASTEPRLWVLDLDRPRVLFEELVAHGQGSGDNYATRFSNDEGSHQTSLGLFRTADTYVGTNGYSLRLDGLEPGVNDRARERAIVVHGAPYVSTASLKALGRLGRSHGCPALRPAIARTVIDTIKQGSLVFAYYPNQQWLRGSRFLNGCS
ncbi:MAG TPA: murein L,D-transpeptidase catalytic domain family protein [Vicinamibacterales bacterium]|nr:murein L,D-transpeptidase catalytic domain family protein [Vicinamibacterales bacterium]